MAGLHTPKNFASTLSLEAAELLETFQWLTPEESTAVMASREAEHVREEVADVMIYLLRLTDALRVDLEDAVRDKLSKNEACFPPVASE